MFSGGKVTQEHWYSAGCFPGECPYAKQGITYDFWATWVNSSPGATHAVFCISPVRHCQGIQRQQE